MTINQAIVERITQLRLKQGYSINKLASLCKISQSTLQHLVDGQNNNPKMSTILKICNGLNISLSNFFDNEIFCKIKE